MGVVTEFRLPDVGEGLTEAEVLTWHVAVGDAVVVNQPLVEIETAKAAVELPCPFEGVVTELLVGVGTLVPVGTPLLSIDVARAEAGGREAVLVGYGVRDSSASPRRRPRISGEPVAGAVGPHGTVRPEVGPPGEPVKPVRHGGLEMARSIESALAQPDSASPVRAKPPVRRLARDLNVDLRHVPATGPHGLVTREDVEAFAGREVSAEGLESEPARRVPVRAVMRSMAEAMTRSAFTAPHVTEWLDIDVSRSMAFLDVLRRDHATPDVRWSPMTLAAHALVRACVRNPMVNASWDADANEIVVHPHVNLGVAAATPRGLVVPVVHDAERLDLRGLAGALTTLTHAARAGTTPPSAMLGGTVTLTNVGVFGVDSGTPILVPGQAIILCLGRILPRAWVVDGQVVPRPVVTVALSFDHRFVDGALGSTVLADVAGYLEDPATALALDTVIRE